MPKLNISKPVQEQINIAREAGIPLCLDATLEAMGDKVVIHTLARWMIHRNMCDEITILETAPGRTSFMLKDCKPVEGVKIVTVPVGQDYPYLNCLKSGERDPLWVLNSYMSATGFYPEIIYGDVKRSSSEDYLRLNEERRPIVIVTLKDSEYNTRRDMNFDHIDKTVTVLRKAGYENIDVYTVEKSDDLPYAKQVSLNQLIHNINDAAVVIAGDTGVSHLTAAMGVPLITLTPDWYVAGKSDLNHTISCSEWWEIPAWHTPYSFVPSAPYDRLRIVELASHKFGIDHLIQSVKAIAEF